MNLRLMRWVRILGGAAAMWLALAAAPARAAQAEQGKFRLHKFEQAIGEESYSVKENGDSFVVHSDFEFTDRSTKVPLTASLHLGRDLTPQSFEIQGSTSRESTIDAGVEAGTERVRIRDGKQWTEAARPDRFFALAGYAPVAMQMMMLRYWKAHGAPARLKTFPTGEVEIEHRGQDEFSSAGEPVKWERYAISGLIWGKETAWLDAEDRLMAVVTVDAEFDHFEAVREGFEAVLPALVARAGQDEMAALGDLAKNFRGERSGRMAFVGGNLIDGTGKALVPDAAVVIDGGRIVAAGPRAKVKIPKGTTILDARGKTILPGLWDMHAHFEQVEWGPVYLAAGVTTARDVGNEFEFITAVRDAIQGGRGLGPRLVLAGIVDGDSPSAIGIDRVNNAEQAAEWVHRYHDHGFRQMKIYSSVTKENIAAIATEAHRLGMTVTGHVPRGLTGFDAVNAGMDQINHIQYIAAMMRVGETPLPPHATAVQRMQAGAAIDVNSPLAQKAIAFLKEHGTVVDPTLALMEMIYRPSNRPVASFEPGVEKVPAELAAQLLNGGLPPPASPIGEALFQKYVEIVGALHRAGVPIVAGTDQAVPGYSLHREMELYVKAGFTPMEAIQAATIVPARVMKMDGEVGTIETGKRADLILVDGNPLESFANLRKVEKVVTNGVLYRCDQLWQSVGFKP